MLEKVDELMKNQIVKLCSVIVTVLSVAIFSSFATQKSIMESVNNYAQYNFKESVRAVLNEDVLPRLQENAIAIDDLKNTTSALADGVYNGYVKDINKYYEKYQKGDYGDLTKTNFEAMAGWWKVLPDSKKTDALIFKYNALMSYYPNLK